MTAELRLEQQIELLRKYVAETSKLEGLRFGADCQEDGRINVWAQFRAGKKQRRTLAASDSHVTEAVVLMALAAIEGALR